MMLLMVYICPENGILKIWLKSVEFKGIEDTPKILKSYSSGSGRGWVGVGSGPVGVGV